MGTQRKVPSCCAGMLVVALTALSMSAANADEEASKEETSKFRPFAEVTKGAEKFDGLFSLYKKDEHLYAVIKPEHLDMPLLAPIAIARGMASAGMPLNFGDEWVLTFRRAGDRLHLVRKNIHYEAPQNSPLAKAVEQNYTDSILLSLPILSVDAPGSGVVVDFADVFLTDFARLGVGSLDRSRSSWHKIKAFQNNIEIQVAATFSRGGYGYYYGFYEDGVVDSRGVTLVVHYSLAKIPSNGYQPRLADQRVGHFLNATKDFGSNDPETNFVRRINRWHFEKADSEAEISVPKRQLVWWVEDTVPHEYRPYVEEGILEWNKAFEKIGFRNALGVRWQNERDDFDPEDINYCTFRWITTPYTFAMSGLRANPITGEMIDGDVVFDASWIKYWMNEYAMLVGKPVSQDDAAGLAPLDVGEVISPMLAARRGFGLPMLPPGAHSHDPYQQHQDPNLPRAVPSSWSPLHSALQQRCSPAHCATCQYSTAKRHEFRLAALALAAAVKKAKEDKKESKEEEKDEAKDKETEFELPAEFIGQAIKEIVMHEVGHSLGLRHNFKASAMLSLEEINDKSITREKGMTGSVMDYNPINISPPGTEQGDYASTTIGPYDYWAIEYAYKPISGDEKEELAKIASRSPEADLVYATDEDLWMSNDPLVNTYDLGNDPLAYGKQRLALAQALMEQLDDKVIKDGQSWARLRSAFSMLLAQYGNAAYLASSLVGGQSFSRDFKGGENSRDPVTPVEGDKQRAALDLLAEEVLSDQAFQFDPELLRRLTMEHWYHWGSDMYYGGSVDFPVYDRVLSIQRIALNNCLSPSVLRRVQNHALLSNEDADPIRMEEIFTKLTDAVWTELESATEDDAEPLELSVVRRNLQREHLRKLCTMVVGTPRSPYYDLYDYIYFYGGSSNYPADAKSLARLHLRNLRTRLNELLADEEVEMDDTTKAHLTDAQEQISRALEARLQANE